MLGRRAGIGLQREGEDAEADARRSRSARQLELLERAAAFYAAHLRSPRSAEAEQAAEYLASRGLDDPIGERFAVGIAPCAATTELLRAAHAAGFSAKEMSDAGLMRRPRARAAPQDRFRCR